MKNETYRDPAQSVDARVRDLLSRMTIEEKVAQMYQHHLEDTERFVRRGCGSVLQVLGPRTNELQRIAINETRLGIPLLFGIDAIHGNCEWPGATVFPSQLTIAASWEPEQARIMGRITAIEMSYTGAHWTFSPVADIARDLRWGRVDETFGEDPLLASRFIEAIVQGYQGKSLSAPHSVLACVKHFAGYCETQGGRDASEGDLSKRKLFSYLLPPHQAAIRAGCATVMIGYHAIDGEPCTTSRWLLRDILKNDWKFDGFAVTDWANVKSLVTKQFTCENIREACVKSIVSGMDMSMLTPEFIDETVAAVKNGDLEIGLIDEAVARILRLKFTMGLFENPRFADLDAGATVIACKEHRAAALEAARKSVTLLKNNGILPLGPNVKKIAVFGANADDEYATLGDWSEIIHNAGVREDSGHPRENTVTVLDGLKVRCGNVTFVRACSWKDDPSDTSGFTEAIETAKKADVCVVVLGDHRKIMGECRDSANLSLPGNQPAFLKMLHATGKPVVLVLIESKPHEISWAAENVAAIVEAFNPGMGGGTAVAELLYGDLNPSGRLPVSFPRATGQLPVYYNQLPGWHAKSYVGLAEGPLFAFGYGLAYTTYKYDNLALASETIPANGKQVVTVHVTNTGKRAGIETVQLYVNDIVSSLTTPVKELKDYKQIELQPGETKTVEFLLPGSSLSLVDNDLQRTVEPGEFEVQVGSSSRDEDLLKARFRVL